MDEVYQQSISSLRRSLHHRLEFLAFYIWRWIRWMVLRQCQLRAGDYIPCHIGNLRPHEHMGNYATFSRHLRTGKMVACHFRKDRCNDLLYSYSGSFDFELGRGKGTDETHTRPRVHCAHSKVWLGCGCLRTLSLRQDFQGVGYKELHVVWWQERENKWHRSHWATS